MKSNPTLLAFDTSTEYLSVAVLNAKGNATEFCQPLPSQQSTFILSTIQDVLHQAKVNKTDIDAIAFGCGPGSFIGVRLAISVAQALAYSLDIPLIPLVTLQTVAQRHFLQHNETQCVVSLDARKGERYWGEFVVEDGIMQTTALHLSAPEHVVPLKDRSLVEDALPAPAALLSLAQYYWQKQQLKAPSEVEPVYLRNQVTS